MRLGNAKQQRQECVLEGNLGKHWQKRPQEVDMTGPGAGWPGGAQSVDFPPHTWITDKCPLDEMNLRSAGERSLVAHPDLPGQGQGGSKECPADAALEPQPSHEQG